MNYIKANHDELLEGFCRGCLVKFNDPAALLHYTEKNRRLFVYATGIQVKSNDAFTFQLCKDCYFNMKMSCKFKKQCRISERRIKNFFRMKDLGDNVTDLVTFLKNCDDKLKFPLFSGNSTPVNRKREDDNDSTCTSIRNFMTDILQDEDSIMPDTEAKIIKEVIEEEADVLEDSLDSHWLQDDISVNSDLRLDFSFSPFTTPHSLNNDHCYTPTKELQISDTHKNYHAKKVFQQLPTRHYGNADNSNISVVKEIFNLKPNDQNIEKNRAVEENFDLSIQNDDNITDAIKNDFAIKKLEINALGMEYEISRRNVNDIGMKQVHLNNFDSESEVPSNTISKDYKAVAFVTEINLGDDSNKEVVTENDNMSVNSTDLNTLENQFELNTQNTNEINNAVDSIGFDSLVNNKNMINKSETLVKSTAITKEVNLESINMGYQKKILNHCNGRFSYTDSLEIGMNTKETDAAVKSINLDDFRIESDSYQNDVINNKLTVADFATLKKQKHTANKSQICGNSTSHFSNSTIDLNDTSGQCNEHDLDSDTKLLEGENNTVNSHKINTPDFKPEYFLEEIISNSIVPVQDPIFEASVNIKHGENVQPTVDTIDKNLEAALRDETNKEFCLDELLVSPAAVYGEGASTPTINNILFGEKLYNETDKVEECVFKTVSAEDEIDVLKEFLKEDGKDLEENLSADKVELPLVLKYDLDNCECKQCDKKFKTLKALKIHLTKIHDIKFPRKKSKHKMNICNFCGKSFNDRGNYSNHLKKHMKEKVTFKCEICALEFSTNSNYKLHLRMHNNPNNSTVAESGVKNGRKYICSICGAIFTTSSNLAVHVRRHTNNYAFKCEICGKGFYRTIEVQTHMRRHTGERPFSCTICKNTYSAKYKLAVHMRKHTDEKPFECHYCSKKFSTKTYLVEHINFSKLCIQKREETEESRKLKPFQCSLCRQNFVKRSGLTRHMKKSLCAKAKLKRDNKIKAEEVEYIKVPEIDELQDIPSLIGQETIIDIFVQS